MTQRPLRSGPTKRQTRNAVTTGWAALVELRARPRGNYGPVRHGNWIHGEYSRELIETRRHAREVFRFLRETRAGRFYPSPFPPPRLKGWRISAAAGKSPARSP